MIYNLCTHATFPSDESHESSDESHEEDNKEYIPSLEMPFALPLERSQSGYHWCGAGQTGSWLTTKCSHFLPSESVSTVSPQNGRTVGILITRVKLKLLEVTSRAGCGIPPWSRYKFPWLDDIPAAIAPTCHTPHCHAAVTWRACHEFHEHHARHRHGEGGNINDNTQQARGKGKRCIYNSNSKYFWLYRAYWLMHVLTPDVSFIVYVYTLRSSCYQQTVHTWAVDAK